MTFPLLLFFVGHPPCHVFLFLSRINDKNASLVFQSNDELFFFPTSLGKKIAAAKISPGISNLFLVRKWTFICLRIVCPGFHQTFDQGKCLSFLAYNCSAFSLEAGWLSADLITGAWNTQGWNSGRGTSKNEGNKSRQLGFYAWGWPF